MNRDIKKDVSQEARTLEAQMPYSIEYDADETTDGHKVYLLSHPELPGCMAQGVTISEAIKELREATVEYLTSLLEDKLPIPLAVSNTITATTTGSNPPVEIVVSQQHGKDFIDTLSKTVKPLGRQHLGIVSTVR